ncbi:MAG TPA: hypothetical protein VMW52_04575 [Phycisphaerae bacterium]|nr:hypothetical protein [Phycisphaerae bacterium]
MRLILCILAAVLCLLLLPGCDLEDMGLRWRATEEVRQSAQVGADLTAALAATGSPPGSAAIRQAANAARVSATYTGPPTQPIDIMDLLTPDTTKAFLVLTAQKDALATRDRVHRRTKTVLSERIAALAGDLAGKAQVSADVVVPQLAALVEVAALGNIIENEIKVPADPGVSESEAAARDALDTALNEAQAAKLAQAARVPTKMEVAEKAVDTGLGLAEKFGLDELLYTGLGALGLGGTAVILRQRSTNKKATQAAADATAQAKAALDVAAAATKNGNGNGSAA